VSGRRRPSRFRRRDRRGIAAIVMVILLIMIGLIVTGVVLAGSGNADMSLRRVETMRSFYAAEAGMNMALRELMAEADEDGDGVVGSISDDGDDGTDPTLQGAAIVVQQTMDSGQVTVTSRGRSGKTVRSVEALLD
jgi:Tfp pilus assembly protein PilX